MRFTHYETGGFFDEMFDADGEPRSAARALSQFIETLPDGEFLRRQQSAERALLHMGITFNVYGDRAGTERIFPFDLVPRIVAAAEWSFIERGLKQRIRALNLFIDDVYHEQRIIKDGVVPAEILRTATSFRQACVGLDPPRGIWCHITGTDLVRDGVVPTANFMCWKTIFAALLACRTSSSTASSSSGPSRSCSNPIESARWTTTRAVCATPSSLSVLRTSRRPAWWF
jgi:uncharacterized circularly permuted ATP-grasp superfamily protein